MMCNMNYACDVLVSLGKAFIGEITENIRAITVNFDYNYASFVVYYDGECTDGNVDGVDCVETEFLSFLPARYRTTYKIIRLDEPDEIPEDEFFFYIRKEEGQEDNVAILKSRQLSILRKMNIFSDANCGNNFPIIPSNDGISRDCQLRLASQYAILGEIPSHLMALIVNSIGNYICLDFYFEGSVGANEIVSANIIKDCFCQCFSNNDIIHHGIFLALPDSRTPISQNVMYRKNGFR